MIIKIIRDHFWASNSKITNDVFQISGDTVSSTVNTGSISDLSNLGNTSLYGFEDYHGLDIGVVRGIRLWFSPLAGEIPIEIKIKDTDTKLGFTISRTEEVYSFYNTQLISSISYKIWQLRTLSFISKCKQIYIYNDWALKRIQTHIHIVFQFFW